MRLLLVFSLLVAAYGGDLETPQCCAGMRLQPPPVETTVYSRDFSSTGLGVTADSVSPVTFTRTSTKQTTAGTSLAVDAAEVTADGIRMDPGVERWALAPTDASSWTAIGSPTTTADQASGPFASYIGHAEADSILDDDGAASEGYLANTECGEDTDPKQGWWYTASCYVAAGSSSSVRVGIVTDGGGSQDCTTTGLTGAFQRVSCTTRVTGAYTTIRGRILVGSDDAATGSVLVSQCDCVHAGAALAPRADKSSLGFGVQATTDRLQISEEEAATWPNGVGSGGEYEVVFSLAYDYPSHAVHIEHIVDVGDVPDTSHTILPTLIQSVSDAGDSGALVGTVISANLYGSDPVVCSDAVDGTPGAIVKSADVGPLTANAFYVQKFRFLPAGTVAGVPRARLWVYFDPCTDPTTCHANTLVASDTTGLHCAATGTPGVVHLGERPTGIRQLAGTIRRLTVKRLRAANPPVVRSGWGSTNAL